MRNYRIALLPGDGIGPEVVSEAVKALRQVDQALGPHFEFQEFAAGAGAYLRSGDALSQDTLEQVIACDAILLGAMGLPGVRQSDGREVSPQLDLREQLDLYCGLRPVYLYAPEHCPLKGYVRGEIDFVIVRENTEGMFWSRKANYAPEADFVTDSLRISRVGADRIFRAAFREAARRRGLVTLVDKSNVLPSMVFFRSVFDKVSSEFPDIRTEKIYVDAASLYFVRRPRSFDVIVTENLFGDILSDLAAGLVGGMGMAPSADIGDRFAVFQPSHGSAPDIAGKSAANPTATILSAAMMLEWLGDPESVQGAAMIRRAVDVVLTKHPAATPDLGGSMTTVELGDRIAAAISQ